MLNAIHMFMYADYTVDNMSVSLILWSCFILCHFN